MGEHSQRRKKLLVATAVISLVVSLAGLIYNYAEINRPIYGTNEAERLNGITEVLAAFAAMTDQNDRWSLEQTAYWTIIELRASVPAGTATEQAAALEGRLGLVRQLNSYLSVHSPASALAEAYTLELSQLLQQGVAAESRRTVTAWRLLEKNTTILRWLLLLPAAYIGIGWAATAKRRSQPLAREVGCELLSIAVATLGSLFVLQGVAFLAGLFAGGFGQLNYPVILDQRLGLLVENFATLLNPVSLISRGQYILGLSTYSWFSSFALATLSFGITVLLRDVALGALATTGLLALGWLSQSGVLRLLPRLGVPNPLMLASIWTSNHFLIEHNLATPQAALLLILWLLGATALIIVGLKRESRSRPLPQLNAFTEDGLHRLLYSVRWKLAAYVILSVIVAAVGTLALLSVAVVLIRLQLFHGLFYRLYELVGVTFPAITIGFLMFAGTFFLLTRGFSNYLEEISQGVSKISAGDFSARLPKRSSDEVGELAENINRMAAQIGHSIAEERRAEQSKNELITSVSHDLRTPLTSVLGYLELVAADRYQDQTELKRYAKIAHQKALRLQKLIDDLFEFTRLSSSGLQAKMKPLDLAELLAQMADEYEPDLRQVQLTARLELPSTKAVIVADGDLLARVFDNLIANGIRYGKSSQHLDIKLEDKEKYLQVSIINYGPIIPAEDLPHVFERFYRADKSRSEQEGGAGLGLAIAKQIVELHGGSIGVTSDENGTCFAVRLPKSDYTEFLHQATPKALV